MEQLWDLGGRTILIIVLCSALFGATAGFALSSYGNFSRVVGIVIGAIFTFPGVVGLAIYAAATRPRRAPVQRAQAATPSAFANAEPSYLGFGEYEATASAAASATATAVAASGFESFDSLQDEVIAATATSAPTALETPARRWRWEWVRTKNGTRAVIAGGLAVLVLLSTLLIAWVSIDAGIIPKFWFYILGTGLDVVVIVTALLVAGGVLLIANRPSRWAAVAVAWIADTWLVLTLIAISARQTVAEFLEQIGALSLTVGDTLNAFGVDTTGGTVELPPGVDLSSLGYPGRSIDLSGIELGTVIPDVGIEVGPALYAILAFAVLANVLVIIALVSADRAKRTIAD